MFQFLNGTVEDGFIKCWTPMEPAALVAFYQDELGVRGFALSEVTNEGVRMGLRWRHSVATFTRGDQLVEIETQAAALTDDTPVAAAAELQASQYSSLTETWMRLRNLAEAAEFEWRDGRWVPTGGSTSLRDGPPAVDRVPLQSGAESHSSSSFSG